MGAAAPRPLRKYQLQSWDIVLKADRAAEAALAAEARDSKETDAVWIRVR